MPRLTPDSDTLFLFDMEDYVSGVNVNFINDSYGNDNLILTGNAYFVTGPGTIKSLRAFETQEAKKILVSNTLLTASWGNNTVEAWLWPNPGHGDIFFFNGPRGAGESIATNFTLRWKLDTNNDWTMFHEYDAGIDLTISQSVSSSNLKNGEWNHVGLVRRATGSNVAIDVYTNGVLDETVELAGELPNSGSGTSEQDLSINWDGLIGSVRFSNIARSGSEISSSAMRTDYTHTTDANTISHWKMQETPQFFNRGIAGHHLTIVDDTPVYHYPPIVGGTTGSLFFNNAKTATTNINNSQIITDITGNNITIDFWCKFIYDDPTQHFTSYGTASETEDSNYLFRLRALSTNKFDYFAEHDAGVDISYTTTASLTNIENKLGAKYFAFVQTRDYNNDLDYIEFYVDGVLFESSSGSALLSIPGGGLDSRLFIPGTDDTNTIVNMQQYRLSKRAFTPEEISQSYADGLVFEIAGAGSTVLDIFRGISGSQYIYYTSADSVPEGLSDIVKIGTKIE